MGAGAIVGRDVVYIQAALGASRKDVVRLAEGQRRNGHGGSINATQDLHVTIDVEDGGRTFAGGKKECAIPTTATSRHTQTWGAHEIHTLGKLQGSQ
jgi:hypothetical protein